MRTLPCVPLPAMTSVRTTSLKAQSHITRSDYQSFNPPPPPYPATPPDPTSGVPLPPGVPDLPIGLKLLNLRFFLLRSPLPIGVSEVSGLSKNPPEIPC